MKNSSYVQEILNRRYHSYSDYDQSAQSFKLIAKLGLFWFIIRELPLKNFYARSAVTFTFIWYLLGYNWKIPYISGLDYHEKPLYYPSKYDMQVLDNYPLIKNFLTYRRNPKINNPGLSEEEIWEKKQYKTFYHHHYKSFRYVLRTRRVIPWDGTFNQPVFPYLDNNDRTGIVHNGCNEIVECKPNAAW